MALCTTIQPVAANTTVMAAEVDSMIFQSSEIPELRAFMDGLSGTTQPQGQPGDSPGRICSYAAAPGTPFRRWPAPEVPGSTPRPRPGVRGPGACAPSPARGRRGGVYSPGGTSAIEYSPALFDIANHGHFNTTMTALMVGEYCRKRGRRRFV